MAEYEIVLRFNCMPNKVIVTGDTSLPASQRPGEPDDEEEYNLENRQIWTYTYDADNYMRLDEIDFEIHAEGYRTKTVTAYASMVEQYPMPVSLSSQRAETDTDWIDSFTNAIKDIPFIGKLADWITQPFQHLHIWINSIATPLDNIADNVGQSVDGWVNDINNAIGDVAGVLGNIGNAVANADDMADDTATWIEDKLTSILDGIW